MTSLRRYYHRYFGRHARFYLAVILTIVVVAYVAVPATVRYVDALRGYAPVYYEPKDVDRQAWLQRHGVPEALTGFHVEVLVDFALFALVAIVWLTLLPWAGRRPPPR